MLRKLDVAVQPEKSARDRILSLLTKCFLKLLDEKNEAAKRHHLDAFEFAKHLFEHNELCVKIVDVITMSIAREELTAQQHKYFCEKVIKHEVEAVNQFLFQLVDVLHDDTSWVQNPTYDPVIKLSLDELQLAVSLGGYLEDCFAARDTRTETDELSIRRMDSLARLFSLDLKLSVCNAVAIHQDELIISFNVSKKTRMVKYLKRRKNG